MTISQALIVAGNKLVGISDAPELDAQWLLLKVLDKVETSWFYTHEEEILSSKQKQEFSQLVKRRFTGEPLAYILGEWEFYGRSFYVNKNVLVPRPSTELLVEEVLRRVKDMAKNKNIITIADIGTGSGCVIVTLCLEIRKWKTENMSTVKFQFIATDVSPAALKVARKNAKRHGVADIIEFRQGDMLEPLKNETIDLIVSNPPYIMSDEISQFNSGDAERAGLSFEPKQALDGGADGQKYIEQIKTAGIPVVIEGTGGIILFYDD